MQSIGELQATGDITAQAVLRQRSAKQLVKYVSNFTPTVFAKGIGALIRWFLY